MEKYLYKKLYQIESHYWWHKGRRKLLGNFLKKCCNGCKNPIILDAGCGTGANLEFLSAYGKAIGVDNSKDALHFCKSNQLNRLALGDIEHLPFPSNSFDGVVALDVIEHMKDDLICLKEFYRVLKPGGFLIICTAAHQILWSYWDELSHHYRRYSRKDSSQKLIDVGFAKVTTSHFNFFMTPIIAMVRCCKSFFLNEDDKNISDFHALPNILNSFLIQVLTFESLIMNIFPIPFGMSLICVSKK